MRLELLKAANELFYSKIYFLFLMQTYEHI